jgi:phosphotransferase system enzyme I (PtsI)
MPSATEKLGRLVLRGLPASEGVCRGRLFVLAPPRPLQIERRPITEGDFPAEIQRLEDALIATRQQLLDVQQRVSAGVGVKDARIFDAQLLVLDDPFLHDEVLNHMRRDRVCIEYAFHDFCQRYFTTLSSVEDKYLSERAVDLRDVAERVLHNLLGQEMPADLSHLREPCIVVAYDLSPSRTATLDRRFVLGFATEQGSMTSHTAILARSLRIPAVTGLEGAVQQLRTGQFALLDGFEGQLIVEPTDQALFAYGQLERRQLAIRGRLEQLRHELAITLDAEHITLSANIEGLEEVADVQAQGAEGVGLFRTEYLFLNRPSPPGEEEQFAAYREVAERLAPAPVIIRTLDLGGDKMPEVAGDLDERNPFLGWRAIRICLQHPDLFKAQLRAILRASPRGNVKLMYPMISGLEELLQANALLEECRQELRAAGQPFNPDMEVGVMIEIPSAALVAESLAAHVHFFSIGTNDLVQYTLAVDRLNPRIAQLYEPTHPAVIRLIKRAVDAAHARGCWVGVCGEMAGEPLFAPLLIGLGADELSAAPGRVPPVKFVIRRLKRAEAAELAGFALNCEKSRDILNRCRDLAHRVAPSLFDLTSDDPDSPNPSAS